MSYKSVCRKSRYCVKLWNQSNGSLRGFKDIFVSAPPRREEILIAYLNLIDFVLRAQFYWLKLLVPASGVVGSGSTTRFFNLSLYNHLNIYMCVVTSHMPIYYARHK